MKIIKKINSIYLLFAEFINKFIPKKITLKIEIIYFLIIFIIFGFLYYNLVSGKFYPSPDGLQNMFFSNNFAKNNSLVYTSELNQKFGSQIFGPRQTIAREDGKIVPTAMYGYIILLGLFEKISTNIFYIINPLLAIIALLYLYKISQLIFKDKRYSFLVVFLASFSAPFLFISNIPFNNISLTAFLLAGAYYLFKQIQNKNLNILDLSLGAIFIGFATLTRYETIFFFIPTILILFFQSYKIEKTRNIKNLIISWLTFLVIIGLFLSLMMFLNLKLYGSVFGIFMPKGTNLIDQTVQNSEYYHYSIFRRIIYWIMPTNIHFIWTNFVNKVFFVNPFFVILFIISIYFLFREKWKEKLIFVGILSIILMQFGLYSIWNWSGIVYKGSPSGSFSRYFLPSWCLIAVLAVYALVNLFKNIKINKLSPILLILFVFFASYNINGFMNKMGYKYALYQKKYFQSLSMKIRANTPEKSVFFSRLQDKYIFPYRFTAMYPVIPENESPKKIASLMDQLLKDQYSVYFIDESHFYIERKGDILNKKIFTEIKKRGLKIKEESIFSREITEMSIYQISK